MNPNTWNVSNLGEVNLIQLGMLYKLLRNDRENLAVKHRNVLQNHVNISYPDREEEIQVRLSQRCLFSTSKADRCGGSGRLLGEVFQAWPNGGRLRRDYICQLAWESLTAPQNEVTKERDVWTCVFRLLSL